MATKLMLIEQVGFHAQTATKEEVIALRDAGVICGARPVTAKEIKAERHRAFNLAHFLRIEARAAFKAETEGKTFTATVLWFNANSGHGQVQVLNQVLTIYACNIAGKKTWFPETACVSYAAGQEVEVSIDVTFTETFVIGLTPGTPDEDKWANLDQSRLAFKCV